MAEVICPSCGKENPAESTFCWFCQARLETAPPAKRNSGALRAEDTPDWLKTMRDKSDVGGRTGDSNLENFGGAENAESQPEWLSKLRERKSAEEKLAHMSGGEEAEEATDWLKKISSDTSSPLPSNNEEEIPAWMQPEQPKSGAEAEEEIPAWMKPEQSEPAGGGEEEIPVWMKPETPKPSEPSIEIPSFQEPEPSAGTEPEEELPDWMKSEPKQATEQPDETPASPQPEAEAQSEGTIDLPDWISGEPEKTNSVSEAVPSFETTPSEPKAAPAEGVPDWLNAEIAENTTSKSEIEDKQTEGETPAPDTDLPDWMKAMASADLPEATSQPAGSMDWLHSAPTSQTEQPEEQVPAEKLPEQSVSTEKTSGGADDTPDWLNDLANWKPEGVKFEETTEPAPATFVPEAAPETPAFSFDLPAEETLKAEEKPAEEEPLPDFLTGTGFTPIETTPEQPAIKEEPPQESFSLPELPQEPPAQPVAAPEPDWLRELEATPATPFDLNTPAEEKAAEAAPTESLPDWLSNIQTDFSAPAENDQPASIFLDENAGGEKAAESTPFAGDEMPDWLSLTSDQGTGGDLGDKVAAFGLEPAQLPGWLEAMKPTESATANLSKEEIDHITEERGPLAGMDGVLPLEDISGVYSRPPVYSTRLLISERQRAHTTLLESVLLEETTPTALPMKPALAPLKLARIFIGILLILMLLFPLVTNSHFMLLPALFPPETVALYDAIETLPDNSPVLLVVDYEPGLSGEVSLSAEQVVRHLMSRNARLAIISTIPTGPALAQDLIARSAAVQTGYDLANQVVNLGYLAGGTTGLQEFVQNPQAAAGYTLDLQPAWSLPALTGITSLNQFSSVIVLTDNQEVSRSWIEQVQPALGNTPLFMVASAQAAPLIQPYVDSGQVQGLLSGLMGSAVYEQIMLQPGNATQYWDAYQYGIVAAVILTLAGVLLQIVTFLRQQGKPKSGA